MVTRSGIISCKCACKCLKLRFFVSSSFRTTEAPQYSHKQGDASISHGIGKSQYSTSHDGIAQVKHWHSERRRALGLKNKNSEIYNVMFNFRIWNLLDQMNHLHIQLHISSCPSDDQTGSSDFQRPRRYIAVCNHINALDNVLFYLRNDLLANSDLSRSN